MNKLQLAPSQHPSNYAPTSTKSPGDSNVGLHKPLAYEVLPISNSSHTEGIDKRWDLIKSKGIEILIESLSSHENYAQLKQLITVIPKVVACINSMSSDEHKKATISFFEYLKDNKKWVNELKFDEPAFNFKAEIFALVKVLLFKEHDAKKAFNKIKQLQNILVKEILPKVESKLQPTTLNSNQAPGNNDAPFQTKNISTNPNYGWNYGGNPNGTYPTSSNQQNINFNRQFNTTTKPTLDLPKNYELILGNIEKHNYASYADFAIALQQRKDAEGSQKSCDELHQRYMLSLLPLLQQVNAFLKGQDEYNEDDLKQKIGRFPPEEQKKFIKVMEDKQYIVFKTEQDVSNFVKKYHNQSLEKYLLDRGYNASYFNKLKFEDLQIRVNRASKGMHLIINKDIWPILPAKGEDYTPIKANANNTDGGKDDLYRLIGTNLSDPHVKRRERYYEDFINQCAIQGNMTKAYLTLFRNFPEDNLQYIKIQLSDQPDNYVIKFSLTQKAGQYV
jgi:hypothetical protein